MIKKQTIEYKLVSIIGLAGEIQTEEIYKLRYGKEYIRKTISMCPPSKNGHKKASKNGMNRNNSFIFVEVVAFIPRFT